MPSSYLAQDEFETYGVAASTSAAAVVSASTMVDAYLKRPEGLCYRTDIDGFPCAMAAKRPTMIYTLTGALQPGVNITVTVQPANLTADAIGAVWLLDEGDGTEAVVIAGVPASGTVILKAVRYAHARGAQAQIGMTLMEERSMPAKRSITRVSQTPVVAILSCLGRYTYGRRSDQIMGGGQDLSLLAMVSAFGGPPAWNPVDVSQVGMSENGEIFVPAGALLAYFSDVKISYVAGWPVGGVPSAIKAATASLVAATMGFAAQMTGNLTSIKAGDTSFTRQVASMIDADILAQIEPFKARLFY